MNMQEEEEILSILPEEDDGEGGEPEPREEVYV